MEETDVVIKNEVVPPLLHHTNVWFHFTWILLLLLIFDLWVFQPLQYVVFLNIGVVVAAFIYILVKKH